MTNPMICPVVSSRRASRFPLPMAPVLALLALAFTALAAPTGARAAGFELALEEIATGIDRPIGLTHAGDGSGRLFIVQQTGEVLVHDGTGVLAQPFLDLAVACCGERGLLGLAFHPGYRTHGFVFVHYSDAAGDTVVSRFEVSAADPNRADPASEVLILSVDQPDQYANHNGGQIAFGPDGHLYIALGDGGGGGDPLGNGQDPGTLLGSILRIDVDGVAPYTVPPDNPFVGVPGARDEIWVYGLRNPWRFSFDRATGDLFIADVGQGEWEEIDLVPADSPGGMNFGWNEMEGHACYPAGSTCNPLDFHLPILAYDHSLGCSVTGGYRYRGPASPMDGVYLFADFCSGRVWAATTSCGKGWRPEQVADYDFQITSFGEDEAGRLYLLGSDQGDGIVYRIAATPTPGLFTDGFETGSLERWNGCFGDA